MFIEILLLQSEEMSMLVKDRLTFAQRNAMSTKLFT